MTDEALYVLNKESHGMWTEQGLDAPWMHLTFPEFQQAIRGVPMFGADGQNDAHIYAAKDAKRKEKDLKSIALCTFVWCFGRIKLPLQPKISFIV